MTHVHFDAVSKSDQIFLFTVGEFDFALAILLIKCFQLGYFLSFSIALLAMKHEDDGQCVCR